MSLDILKYSENLGQPQWRIGISSLLASSVGLAPFKDVFWSTYNEPNNTYGPIAFEPYAEHEALVTTLTTGPVGPGDKIQFMNKTIITRLFKINK